MRGRSGQSLIEVAVMMPVLVLLIGYAIDFGYFFIVAATITSAARNAAEYSAQGFESPGANAVAPAGPSSLTTSVAAAAMADVASLVNSSTVTSVQVCTKALGVTSSLANCGNYGVVAGVYVPTLDPEAPFFILQRVDVTYTVQPPVALSLFSISFLPSLQFHRQVSMRGMD